MAEAEQKPVQQFSAKELTLIDHALGMSIDLMEALNAPLIRHPIKEVVETILEASMRVRAKVKHYAIDAELAEKEAEAEANG